MHFLHLEDGLPDRDRGYAFGRHEFPKADVALFPGGADHRFALSGVEPLVDSGVAAQLRGFREAIHPRKARFRYDKNIYRQIEPGTFAYIRNYSNGSSNRASFFSLEEYESGAMTASLEAAEVRFNPETKPLVRPRYTTRTFDSLGVETFTQHRNLDTLINLDVNELGRTDQLIKTMNIVELNQFLEQQRSKGSDSINIIQVEQHARYAYPVGTFILTLIGVSLSSRKVRGGTGLHIGIGIALCFSYILFIRFFEEFAKSGTLPPWIAVWIPNVLYLCIAVYLYRKAPK